MTEIIDSLSSFCTHFKDVDPADDSTSIEVEKFDENKLLWPSLRQLVLKTPKYVNPVIPNEVPKTENPILALDEFQIQTSLKNNIRKAGAALIPEGSTTPLQLEMLSIINQYKDLYYTERNFDNGEQIRLVYCLHVLDHVLKTRSIIMANNASITSKFDVPDEMRDQGVVRPSVLILAPFKDSAFKIINMMSTMMFPNQKGNVINRKRFQDEFTGEEITVSQKSSRPDDFSKTFAGNIDDNFKIGISITKKSLKLYTDFYHCDIIIASPLGLRMVIGSEGESEYDYDFLSSIEVLILDQADVFLMQNWDHVLHIMDHVNLQPRKSHDTDFSRVRYWAANGWSKYYRQNLIFCSHPSLQISALVSRKCHNYAGCARTANPVARGTISQVVVSIPHIFHRLTDTSAVKTADERFEVFTQKLLPQCQDNLKKGVLIYVPSYFDFIRLRNYFISEAISFADICEYTKDKKVAEARDMFFHSEVNYLLYSERFHFFMRRRVRGIRHLIFYQLPTFPHFYSELCNLMNDANKRIKTEEDICSSITGIYSKFDAPQLASIVSSDRAAQMLASKKDVHMIMVEST
ncbi:U3 small nucleolar RNA-associated protein 25 homolog isoform X2 [Planococcus citri]